ncbi:MAG: substrate-binding domain-containing protein [Chloroflexi bacterium]|nr:substrate-binding domain-containing protein [Chloroflexota bacterium]
MNRRSLLAAIAFVSIFAAFACGGDGDDASKTPTVPTVNATTELTQSAINTQESGGSETPTRVPGPATQPTKASGDIILATTTSTQDSGLLDVLVPMFEDETGYTVKTVAVGSGAAIEQASRGDADVVLVHSPAAEKKMVEDGNGIERTLVMHNDFIIVGPADGPAAVKDQERADDALKAIAGAEAKFISRGDDSGTNALELKLWTATTIDPAGQSWYEETGQGMGATLQIASQKAGYTISDRATFLAQEANLDLEILLDGDPGLLNVYHVIVVNPDVHTNVNAAGARAFAVWITRADIQQIIGEFGVADFGEPLFFPDAGKPEPAG